MSIGDGYNPSTVSDQAAQAEVEKLTSDPEFRARYFSEDKPVRDFAVTQMEIAQRKRLIPLTQVCLYVVS